MKILLYLLFDIGGTKMRIAVSPDGRKISEMRVFATPKTFIKGVVLFNKVITEIRGKKKIKAMAGGIAGVLDKNHSTLLANKNLRGWENKPLKSVLEKILKAPVYLENDAALAGLGETMYGAGKGNRIVTYITVSTGVGGARIVDGKIDVNVAGFEPGFQIIDLDASIFPRLKIRRLGRFISGNAIQNRFKRPPAEITNNNVQNELAQYLAVGLSNTIIHWSPDVVVLGGSVMNIIPLASVRRQLKKNLKPFPKPPPVVRAKLGDSGGLWGALELLKQKSKIKR